MYLKNVLNTLLEVRSECKGSHEGVYVSPTGNRILLMVFKEQLDLFIRKVMASWRLNAGVAVGRGGGARLEVGKRLGSRCHSPCRR